MIYDYEEMKQLEEDALQEFAASTERVPPTLDVFLMGTESLDTLFPQKTFVIPDCS